jgi:hypothetical protein
LLNVRSNDRCRNLCIERRQDIYTLLPILRYISHKIEIITRLGRKRVKKAFLYVSAKPDKATEQILKRQKQLAVLPKEVDPIPVTTIIEVLIEAIHAGRISIRPTLVANRLSVRGVPITVRQVEQIFAQYGIATEKKTA